MHNCECAIINNFKYRKVSVGTPTAPRNAIEHLFLVRCTPYWKTQATIIGKSIKELSSLSYVIAIAQICHWINFPVDVVL